VLFYDTENLFHTVDDAGVNDEEFLPKGWTIKPPVFKSTKIGGSYKYQGPWQTIDFFLTNIHTLESNMISLVTLLQKDTKWGRI